MTKPIIGKKGFTNTAYSQKLQDPRWQRVRLKVLERDNWTCVHCGDKAETLHAHHTYYEDKSDGKEPWDYSENSIVTLCATCHNNEHEDLPLYRGDLTRAVSRAGFGRVVALNALAEGFQFSPTFMNEKDLSVVAYAIQSLLASKYVSETGEGQEDIEENFCCDAAPSIWELADRAYSEYFERKKATRLSVKGDL